MSPLAIPLTQALERREERALLVAYLCSGVGAAYALEEWWLIAPVILTALLFVPLRRRKPKAPPAVEGAVAIVAALIAAPVTLVLGAPAPALALFLISAQSVKLLAPRTERDKGTCCLVSVALVGVAASEAVEPPIAALLLISIASVLSFARSRDLRFHGLPKRPRPEPRGPRWVGQPRSGRSLRGRAGVGLVIALGTVAFFFAFPRVGAKLLASQRASNDRLSGFTDEVGLEDIGRIKQSDSVAFRVETDAPGYGEGSYWKGRVLDQYDGMRWSASSWFRLTRHRLQLTGPLMFTDHRVYGPGERVTLNFFVEPLGTRCLFTTGQVRQLQFRSARPRWLSRDDLGSTLVPRPYATSLAYTLHTYPDDEPSTFFLGKAAAFRLRQHCLQFPESLDKQRMLAYTDRALRDQRVKPDAGAAAVAAGLAAHLRLEFTYSLTIDSTPGREPVEEFLYERRSGHCELFASAHALMLRARGIPTRVVTGFRGGEISGWSGSITVRQRDAHAWVEVLTEDGWKRYDPTPAQAGEESGAAEQIASTLAELINWMELRWFSMVIAFDAYDQRNYLVRAQEWLALRLGIEEHAATVGRALGLSVIGLLALGAGLAAWVLVRRPRRDSGGDLRRRAIVEEPSDEELAELLAALARHGMTRRPAETPLELAERASLILPVDGHLRRWVRGYYAQRFGAAEDPRPPLAAVLRALEADRG